VGDKITTIYYLNFKLLSLKTFGMKYTQSI
jgi:hypothetical protein